MDEHDHLLASSTLVQSDALAVDYHRPPQWQIGQVANANDTMKRAIASATGRIDYLHCSGYCITVITRHTIFDDALTYRC